MSGLASPLSTPPRPSPNHHTASAQTTLPASAARTAGRHSSPAPSSSWVTANAAFQAAGACRTSRVNAMAGPVTPAGLPM